MTVYGQTGFWSGDKPGTKEQIFSHMKAPRGSVHRSGCRTILTSVRTSNPLSTILLACPIKFRVRQTASSISSAEASISKASWTGAQTRMPCSTAAITASRNISEPAQVFVESVFLYTRIWHGTVLSRFAVRCLPRFEPACYDYL